MNGISKADVVDVDFVDAYELVTDGTTVYLTITVVSTTSGSKTVVVNLASDGEGIITGRDHPVQVGDFVDISGTSGGTGDGTFTVASLLTDTSFIVVETIGTSTGGSASFRYPPGAKAVGFDSTKQNVTSSTNLQQGVTDVSNASLLDDEPGSVNTTYSNTRSGTKVTNETWINTANSRNIKTIDYTYSGSKVTQEVHKVFAASDGTTILAQKTINYTYTGSIVTGETITRDV